MVDLSLKEFVKHPITVGFSAVTFLAHSVQFAPLDALGAVVWANVPSLFTLFSISAFTIAPNTPLPKQPVLVAAILFAALYGLKLVSNFANDLQERFE